MLTQPRRKRLGRIGILFAAGAMALTPLAVKAAEPTDKDLKNRIDQLEKELKQIKADQQKTRSHQDETRGLIDGTMTGGSHADGAVAGKGKKFFLASPDSAFTLNFDGQVQARYILGTTDNGPGGATDVTDGTLSGFQIRRAKVGFSGNIYNKNLKYKIKAGFGRDGGGFALEEAYAQWNLDEGCYIKVGQFKGRFMHEELVSSSKQMAAERSGFNEYFTLDYTQGVELGGEINDQTTWSVVWHDGREVENVDVPDDATDFGIAGRIESALIGDAGRHKDFATWSKDMGESLLIGGGFDYELAETGAGPGAVDWDNFFQYTFDASYEVDGWSLYAAYAARTVEQAGGGPDIDQKGYVVQVSKMIVPDKQDLFFRYEVVDTDNFPEITGGTMGITPEAFLEPKQTILTFGTNLYEHKHASKLTVDFSIAPDGIRRGESGAGNDDFETDTDEPFMMLRVQYQLLF